MVPTDQTTDERSQIMTRHESKGLEFDVVIVPGIVRSHRSDSPTLLTWDRALGTDVDADPQFVLAVGADRGDDKHPLIANRIACTFIDPTGTRWIIDYKTNLHDTDTFRTTQLASYTDQLLRSADVMQRCFMSENILTGVWLPVMCQLITV